MLAVFAFLGLSHAAYAQGLTANEVLPGQVAANIGLTSTDIRVTIANIIRAALGLLGVIALLLVLYGGFLWMTAAGDDEKVLLAKKTLVSAVIGLIIILLSVAIVSFIISRLLSPGGGGGPGGTETSQNDAACIGLTTTCPVGALGTIIESHWPARSAIGIPRNTRIAITFKSKIKQSSVTVGGQGTVAIMKSSQTVGTTCNTATNPTCDAFLTKYAQSLAATDFDVVWTADSKTVVFLQKNCPPDCFGSPSENVWYTVALRGGSSGILKLDESPAFTGTLSSGYPWDFQASTVLDTTPPKVSYIVPGKNETNVVRNSIIEVSFDEAVDPVSMQAGISIKDAAAHNIPGTQLFGNAYRTLEFRTDDPCGVNSCGETIYCLPKSQDIAVLLKADALVTPVRGNLGIYLPDGVTDMSGNSLDGNGNGTSQGHLVDDYPFTFTTNDTIDLEPPKILTENPVVKDNGRGDIPRDADIDATFDKTMSAISITSDSMRLLPPSTNLQTNFYVTSAPVLSATPGVDLHQTKATIRHDLLPADSTRYAADITSGLRDTHQNCFYPGGKSCNDPTKPYCCNGIAKDTACGYAPSP